jgi:hypothetical protein
MRSNAPSLFLTALAAQSCGGEPTLVRGPALYQGFEIQLELTAAVFFDEGPSLLLMDEEVRCSEFGGYYADGRTFVTANTLYGDLVVTSGRIEVTPWIFVDCEAFERPEPGLESELIIDRASDRRISGHARLKFGPDYRLGEGNAVEGYFEAEHCDHVFPGPGTIFRGACAPD